MAQTPPFKAFETSSGAQIFGLPVEAFPGFWAYAYLVSTDNSLVLIDSGSGSDSSHACLEAGFERASGEAGKPLRIEDLTHILITHGHIDHFGGLVRLRDRTRARIGVHELDLQTVSRHEQRLALMSRRLENFLVQAGASAEQREQMLQMYRFTKAIYHSIPADFTYEAVDMRVGPFEMVHVPGHCPGHVAIRLDDVIFCGDLVVERVTPHQSPEELTPFMGLRHYLDSLSFFQHWAEGSRLTLCGHDAPVENLAGRIAEIRAHLAGRLHQVLEALAEPLTPAQISAQIYGELNGYNALLVIEKTGAYVEYLYQRGLLEITNLDEFDRGGEMVIRYRRLHNVSGADILPKEKRYVFV